MTTIPPADPNTWLRDQLGEQWARDILDEHKPTKVMVMRGDGFGFPGTYCGCCSPSNPNARQRYPCRTVRLLALPYADHPGYPDEWKP